MKNNLVVFSGAGMSAESGITTFRDSNGLWENYKIEEVATPEAWERNPNLVTEFYNMRRKQILDTEPNEAHLYFAEIQNEYNVHVVTQNIDDLHERAGSKNVLHLHGQIVLAKSSNSQHKELYPIKGWKLTEKDICNYGYRLRPHVVWFGEDVPELNNASRLIQQADILIVLGTSLQVYPAAGLIHSAKPEALKIIIDPNCESFHLPNDFIRINNNASEGVKRLKDFM
jgi:NAD-dependent deacetylase